MEKSRLKEFLKYKGKKVVVPWSGGLDSTTLLITLAHVGAEVCALSFSGGNLPNDKHESHARTNLRNIIQKRNCGEYIKFKDITLPTLGGMWPGAYKAAQHSLWIKMLPLVIPNADFVFLGYVVGDGCVSQEKEIQKEWNAGNFNIHHDYTMPTLVLPLRTFVKPDVCRLFTDVIEREHFDGLDDHITFCQSTTKLGNHLYGCGDCPSCDTAKSTGTNHLQVLVNRENPNRVLREWIPRMAGTDGVKLFRMRESEKVNSFFISIECEAGDGSAPYNRKHFSVDFTKDTDAIIYLGTMEGDSLHGQDFPLEVAFSEIYHIVNQAEYKVRQLTYLAEKGYTDIDLIEAMDATCKTKEDN